MVATKQRQARRPSLPVGSGVRRSVREAVNLGLLTLWLASLGVRNFIAFCFIGVITVYSGKYGRIGEALSRPVGLQAALAFTLHPGRWRYMAGFCGFGAKSRAEDD